MSTPVFTTSAVMPVRLRQDLPRDEARAYWAGPHSEIVKRLPHILEYNQHHFSETDKGYWPATDGVGTRIPTSWPIDGIAEARFTSLGASLSIPLHMREVYFDEQNIFERVIGQFTMPRGGRWWTTGHDESVGHRTVVLLRRRRGTSARSFGRYVHSVLGPALHMAGARDVRTYVLLSLTSRFYRTAGIAHDNPPHRRYHAIVIFGTETRAAVDDLMATAAVSLAVKEQSRYCIGMHAFAVERTVPCVRAF